MKELMTALVAAQAEMENASKDSNNPFFKSKYADLNSVMGAVKPAFAKHGLGFVQICHDAEDAAKVETMIIHVSGQTLSCGAVSVPVSKGDAQGYGSALTYARRYSLAAAAGVGAEDDDANAAAKAAPKKPEKAFASTHKGTDGALEKLSEDDRFYIKELALEVGSLAVFDDVAAAHKLIEDNNLEPDQKVALWSLLGSKERAAIKKHAESAKLEKQNG
jgi:hypothetical protein